MKKILIITAFLLLGIAPGLRAASFFDEEKKDAASNVVMDVETDRQVTVEENRKFVQSQPNYVKTKLKEFDDKLAKMNSRIKRLESEVKVLSENGSSRFRVGKFQSF